MIRRNVFKILFCTIFVVQFAFSDDLVININKGTLAPIPVAINKFFGNDEGIVNDMMSVINNDLNSTGLFNLLPQEAFIQHLMDIKTIPNFAEWRLINAQVLIVGEANVVGDNINATFRLYDILTERELFNYTLSGNKRGLRQIAHMIADRIYNKLTGEDFYFNTRIVYVSEHLSGRKDKKVIKRLAIMDQDGANHKFLTDGSRIVMTPRFSPVKQEITYFTYTEKVFPNGKRIVDSGKVHMLDLQTGKISSISLEGMTFAPRYHPDGKTIIFSLSKHGASAIYTFNLETKEIKRITVPLAMSIDTSPCYSPDGKYITFNSDRGGSQQIYVMNSDGSDIHRVSFGEGQYATPVWSPRGDWIAFTKLTRKDFYIGIMRPDGSNERMLASCPYIVEGPTWAPNGRVVAFIRQNENELPRIYSIDVTGHNEKLLNTPASASDPAWSPLIQ